MGQPAPAGRGPIGAVIFDMDGVLFEGRNFWMDLHLRLGGDAQEATEIVDRYLSTDYETLAELIVGGLWRGKPAAPYLELVAERSYQPGAAETFESLRSAGIRTAIVSSGPDLLAQRAQRELGAGPIRANGLEIADGVLTGKATIQVPDAEKAEVGLALLEELGVDPAHAASIGDSESDAVLADRVGASIAYDSRSELLLDVADHRLNHGELGRLPELLSKHMGQPGLEPGTDGL